MEGGLEEEEEEEEEEQMIQCFNVYHTFLT